MKDKKTILVLLTDKWNDWEASYVIAGASSYANYKVKTIAIDQQPKVSMGNIRAMIDYAISDFKNFDDVALVILPGGLSWTTNDYAEIVDFMHEVIKRKIVVAAACGATLFLAKYGFLNNIKHTGNNLEEFKKFEDYHGEKLYVSKPVVADNDMITAYDYAAVDFAYEMFKILNMDNDGMKQWYQSFKK